MVERRPIVYLPIEFRSREFDSKMLLACVLVQRGYSVLIGRQKAIYFNLAQLPPGAVLFKSFNSLWHGYMQEARQAGHHVGMQEEELLAHMERKAIRNYCASGIFDLSDAIYANGDLEKDVLSEFSGGKVPIEVVGNSRVDLLKPSFRGFFKGEIAAIRARFGDFVLVNTNFGIINSTFNDLKTVTDIHIRGGFIKPDDPSSVQAWDDQIEFERLNREAVLTAIRELSVRRPRLKIVLRPHPAESVARWDGVFADFPNVSAVREGAHGQTGAGPAGKLTPAPRAHHRPGAAAGLRPLGRGPRRARAHDVGDCRGPSGAECAGQ